ncbi:MAG: threonine/serine exporter family protein [Chloroflexi bacterium]|nr:threonine/serine exporter family protein [Chloroflexota bacterium]
MTRELEIAFLSQLGCALSAAGDPVSSTEKTLQRIARENGLQDVAIGVLPTLVLVRGRDGQTPVMDLAAADVDHNLRLDQIGCLYDIVDAARLGRLSADDGLARLAEMWSMRPRFGVLVRILGQVILSVGLGLIITPRPTALLYCAALGLLVGALIELGRRSATLEVLLPFVASLLVSLIVFAATDAGQVVAPLLLLIPPLITFLPGGMLTTAMLELADHHPIAGASRLVAGATQVLLLVFGIVAGQLFVGLPEELAFAKRSDNLLGWWAPWLGPLVFAIGVYFHFVGPRRSLVWLCLIVYVAAVAEQVGSTIMGGYLGGFVGAAAMIVFAVWLDRLPAAPPFQVVFLPAFWLLVPGVLAVVGVAELVGTEDAVAMADVGRVVFTILSIALGVLVGVALSRVLHLSDIS